jgi:hypothetical protein
MTVIIVNDLEGFPFSPQFSLLSHHIFIYLSPPPPLNTDDISPFRPSLLDLHITVVLISH